MSRNAAIALLIMTGLVAACAPQKLPGTKVGKPYAINGKTYYPSHDAGYDTIGEASWYGPGFHGEYTANGEVYDQSDLTAAHPTLPMPSLVRVTNLKNGKSAVIRINDRGPFAANRIIDLSKKSAEVLGIRGISQVRVQYLEEETQNYIAMVKANDRRIIRMADYNKRAAEWKTAQMTSAGNEDIAAPTPVTTPTATHSILIKDVMADELVAAPPTMPAPHEAAPAAEGMYAIQLGSFASEANARKLAARLENTASPAVDRVEIKGKTWWRVRINGLQDRYAADSLAETVRAAGIPDARVIRP